MDPKKEIRGLRNQIDALEAALKEELPFQKELAFFEEDIVWEVKGARCGFVKIRGISGTVFKIDGRGNIRITTVAPEYQITPANLSALKSSLTL